MSKRIIFSAVLALPVMLFFQNCSDVSFESVDSAQLVAKADTTLPNTDVTTGSNTDTSTDTDTEDVVVEDDTETDTEVDDSTDLNYICVLDGPGKSVSLHLRQELQSGNSTIDIVCTSRSACTDIVSKSFALKSVERRGFCGKNKHAITLTGAEISGLLK